MTSRKRKMVDIVRAGEISDFLSILTRTFRTRISLISSNDADLITSRGIPGGCEIACLGEDKDEEMKGSCQSIWKSVSSGEVPNVNVCPNGRCILSIPLVIHSEKIGYAIACGLSVCEVASGTSEQGLEAIKLILQDTFSYIFNCADALDDMSGGICERTDWAMHILNLSREVTKSTNSNEITDIFLKQMIDELGADAAFVVRLDVIYNSQWIELMNGKEHQEDYHKEGRLLVAEEWDFLKCVVDNNPIILGASEIKKNADKWEKLTKLKSIKSIILVPILLCNGLEGIVGVCNGNSKLVWPDSQFLFLCSKLVAGAIANIILQEKQRAEQKLREWRNISAKAAHRIGNQVANFEGILMRLRDEFDKKAPDMEHRAYLMERLENAISTMRANSKAYKSFIVASEVNRISTDIEKLINECVESERTTLAGKDIHIEIEEDLPAIQADKQKLKEAISELLVNASRWTEDKGRITISAWKATDEDKRELELLERNGWLRIDVVNQGKGISKELKEKIFEPYFTTYPHGTGLGLATVGEIIMAHGGIIKEVGTEGVDADFAIALPIEKQLGDDKNG